MDWICLPTVRLILFSGHIPHCVFSLSHVWLFVIPRRIVSIHWNLLTRILEWVSHSLLQEIFPTQGLNHCLLHCSQILYCLSNQMNITHMKCNKEREISNWLRIVEAWKVQTVESASRLETQGGIDAAAWVWRQSGGRILFYQGPHAVFC